MTDRPAQSADDVRMTMDRIEAAKLPVGTLVEATFEDGSKHRYYVDKLATLVAAGFRDQFPDDPPEMYRCQDPLTSVLWSRVKFEVVERHIDGLVAGEAP